MNEERKVQRAINFFHHVAKRIQDPTTSIEGKIMFSQTLVDKYYHLPPNVQLAVKQSFDI